MGFKVDKTAAAVGAAAAVALLAIGVPAIADAASSTPSPSPSSGSGTPGYSGDHRFGPEAELTGATAVKVRAAVLAKLPGATVHRVSVENSREGTGAAYEAHVTTADGTKVQVLLNKAFAVISVSADRGRGGLGHGGLGHGGFGHGGFGPEAQLSGTTAAKVQAAVLAKLPGATIRRLSVENSQEGTGAAYEVHVTKTDGSDARVLLDRNYAVTSVTADGHHGGWGRFRGNDGQPGSGTGSNGGTRSNGGTSGPGSSSGSAAPAVYFS